MNHMQPNKCAANTILPSSLISRTMEGFRCRAKSTWAILRDRRSILMSFSSRISRTALSRHEFVAENMNTTAQHKHARYVHLRQCSELSHLNSTKNSTTKEELQHTARSSSSTERDFDTRVYIVYRATTSRNPHICDRFSCVIY